MGSGTPTGAVVADTQDRHPAAGSEGLPRSPTFAPAAIQLLHKEDRHAGAYIVSIMLAIFSLALVAYTAIALYAAYGQ